MFSASQFKRIELRRKLAPSHKIVGLQRNGNFNPFTIYCKFHILVKQNFSRIFVAKLQRQIREQHIAIKKQLQPISLKRCIYSNIFQNRSIYFLHQHFSKNSVPDGLHVFTVGMSFFAYAMYHRIIDRYFDKMFSLRQVTHHKRMRSRKRLTRPDGFPVDFQRTFPKHTLKNDSPRSRFRSFYLPRINSLANELRFSRKTT